MSKGSRGPWRYLPLDAKGGSTSEDCDLKVPPLRCKGWILAQVTAGCCTPLWGVEPTTEKDPGCWCSIWVLPLKGRANNIQGVQDVDTGSGTTTYNIQGVQDVDTGSGTTTYKESRMLTHDLATGVLPHGCANRPWALGGHSLLGYRTCRLVPF